MTKTKTKKQAITRPTKSSKLHADGLPPAQALKVADDLMDRMLGRSDAEAKVHAKVEALSDSFTTEDASFSVEVKNPWGSCIEDITVKIDCNGEIHGDEETIDVLIEMLENARDNLLKRRGQAVTARS